MTEHPLIAIPNDKNAPKRLFELKTVFAVAGDDEVSFGTEIHPQAKCLVSLFIYDEQQKIYLLQRFNVKDGKDGDVWFDLPGGKIDPGETVGQAAMREAMEELGIEINDMEQICQSYAAPCERYPHGLVKYFIHVKSYEGTPQNVLGEEEGHLSLKAYNLAEAEGLVGTRLCDYSKSHLRAPPQHLSIV